jgi:eukaryotic-like serine/threonine-protein kinase
MAESIGSFKIVGELGKGAHSTIYHIRRDDNRQFALKVVPINDREDAKYLQQAENEFKIGLMLEHPNLVKIHTLEMQRDWLWRVKKVHLLIELVQGKTLDQTPRLTVPRLVQVFEKIAQGLHHMHRRKVLHADLKPNNVMISKAGAVKIIDFGLAWIKDEPKERMQGTPEYMAPEQARDGTVSEQTDIYNLGATMYRMTTWQLPPSTVAPPGTPALDAKLFQKLLKPVAELSPTAPGELCDLIHRCLSFSPKKRPERVKDIIVELNGMIENLVQSDDDRLESLGW